MNAHPPIYVINMAQDVERMVSMAQQLDAQGLRYERVDAIVGRQLSPQQRRASLSKFWYYFFMGRVPSDGELVCTLSHRLVWKMMLDRGQQWAVIFEDDALLSPTFASQFAMFEKATTAYDVVHFFSLNQPSIIKDNYFDQEFRLMAYAGANTTATAYGLRMAGAKKLLKYKPVIFTNDKWVMARALLGVKCIAIIPFPVAMHVSHSVHSTIGDEGSTKRQGALLWRITLLPILRLVRTVVLKIRGI